MLPRQPPDSILARAWLYVTWQEGQPYNPAQRHALQRVLTARTAPQRLDTGLLVRVPSGLAWWRCRSSRRAAAPGPPWTRSPDKPRRRVASRRRDAPAAAGRRAP